MNEEVTTWSDGHGIWLARLQFAEPLSAEAFALEHPGLEAKARRAIRKELRIRGDIATGYRLKVKLESKAVLSDGRVHSVTFREH